MFPFISIYSAKAAKLCETIDTRPVIISDLASSIPLTEVPQSGSDEEMSTIDVEGFSDGPPELSATPPKIIPDSTTSPKSLPRNATPTKPDRATPTRPLPDSHTESSEVDHTSDFKASELKEKPGPTISFPSENSSTGSDKSKSMSHLQKSKVGHISKDVGSKEKKSEPALPKSLIPPPVSDLASSPLHPALPVIFTLPMALRLHKRTDTSDRTSSPKVASSSLKSSTPKRKLDVNAVMPSPSLKIVEDSSPNAASASQEKGKLEEASPKVSVKSLRQEMDGSGSANSVSSRRKRGRKTLTKKSKSKSASPTVLPSTSGQKELRSDSPKILPVQRIFSHTISVKVPHTKILGHKERSVSPTPVVVSPSPKQSLRDGEITENIEVSKSDSEQEPCNRRVSPPKTSPRKSGRKKSDSDDPPKITHGKSRRLHDESSPAHDQESPQQSSKQKEDDNAENAASEQEPAGHGISIAASEQEPSRSLSPPETSPNKSGRKETGSKQESDPPKMIFMHRRSRRLLESSSEEPNDTASQTASKQSSGENKDDGTISMISGRSKQEPSCSIVSPKCSSGRSGKKSGSEKECDSPKEIHVSGSDQESDRNVSPVPPERNLRQEDDNSVTEIADSKQDPHRNVSPPKPSRQKNKASHVASPRKERKARKRIRQESSDRSASPETSLPKRSRQTSKTGRIASPNKRGARERSEQEESDRSVSPLPKRSRQKKKPGRTASPSTEKGSRKRIRQEPGRTASPSTEKGSRKRIRQESDRSVSPVAVPAKRSSRQGKNPAASPSIKPRETRRRNRSVSDRESDRSVSPMTPPPPPTTRGQRKNKPGSDRIHSVPSPKTSMRSTRLSPIPSRKDATRKHGAKTFRGEHYYSMLKKSKSLPGLGRKMPNSSASGSARERKGAAARWSSDEEDDQEDYSNREGDEDDVSDEQNMELSPSRFYKQQAISRSSSSASGEGSSLMNSNGRSSTLSKDGPTIVRKVRRSEERFVRKLY